VLGLAAAFSVLLPVTELLALALLVLLLGLLRTTAQLTQT
jgi:hypothetical protein